MGRPLAFPDSLSGFRFYWTFYKDGRIVSKRPDGRIGRSHWKLKDDCVLIIHDGGLAGREDMKWWSTFNYPIRAKGTRGDNWSGLDDIEAVKVE